MTRRKKWVGTSWKMNKTLSSARAFAEGLQARLTPCDDVIQPFVVPPFTLVREVKRALAQSHVLVGAQNMHWEDAGAWTGEISPPMLADCNLDLVELGHSERRRHFAETDDTVGLKVAAAVRHGLIPLICVGETRAERDAGTTSARLEEQVRGALKHIKEGALIPRLLFAYEPVWAIGDGGVPATSEYADARHAEISELAFDILGQRVSCLYGGSVTAQNCEELIDRPHIDGLFIGRAAWDVDGYLEIIEKCAAVVRGERNRL